MAVISNKLRNFAAAMCQSLKEIVTVSQNTSTAISSFTRTDNTSYGHSWSSLVSLSWKETDIQNFILAINILVGEKPLARKTLGDFAKQES